jgi:probable HAF family extracellular repeat protein
MVALPKLDASTDEMETSMKRGLLLLGVMLCLQLGVLPAARAEVVYTVTVVGGAGSAAYDVNNRGQVVGYMAAGETYHAFLYDAGILSDLGTLGNGVSYASRLNESGTVVGTSYVDDQPYAFTYANGAMTALPTGPLSYANDINNAGVIAGTFAGTDSEGWYQPHAYTYAGGAVTDLGTLGYGSYGNAINDHGQVAGTAEIDGPPNRPTDPFFYSNGVMQNIGNLGGIFSNAWAMNNQGHVVGSAGATPSGGNFYPFRAFVYDGNGLHDLGVMAKDGNSSAYGINELGQVVGFTDTDTGSATYLYTDGAMVLLDTLIDPASGWTITDANGINDLGQIAGRACKGELCYAVRLDLAAAVPEPGQASMLGIGLLLVLGRIACRKWAGAGARRSASPSRAWLPAALSALLVPVASCQATCLDRRRTRDHT